MSHPSPTIALLDRRASFTGTAAAHDLEVLGSLEGELKLTGRLHVAAGGSLRARVQAGVVELEGEFEGQLRAETLRVAATARARGTFAADRLSIEEGAVLDGSVQMPAAAAELALVPAPKAPNGHAVDDPSVVERTSAAEEPSADAPAAATPA